MLRQSYIDGLHEGIDLIEQTIKVLGSTSSSARGWLESAKRELQIELGNALTEQARQAWKDRPQQG